MEPPSTLDAEKGSARWLDGLIQKVAVITGGASGIGRATVELFAAEGARVVIADIQEEAGTALATQLGGDVAFVRTDVTQETDVGSLIEQTVTRSGRVDIMFNNAGGGGRSGDLVELDADGFDRAVGLLLRSVALGHKFAGRVMKAQGSGSIISTVSIAGLAGEEGVDVSFAAGKAAILNVVRTAMVELAPFGVRSNAIAPGLIITPIFLGLVPAMEPDDGQRFLDRLARPRCLRPADPAGGTPRGHRSSRAVPRVGRFVVHVLPDARRGWRIHSDPAHESLRRDRGRLRGHQSTDRSDVSRVSRPRGFTAYERRELEARDQG